MASFSPLLRDHMLAIQSRSLGSADKPGTICAWPSICRGQCARISMLRDEVLTLKFLHLDGPAAGADMVCGIVTLACESWNTFVRGGALLAKSFRSSARSMKILCCLWKFVCLQTA